MEFEVTGQAKGETKRYVESPSFTEHLVPFVEWLLNRHDRHDGVTEIRILGLANQKKVTWAGYFDKDHIGELITAVLPCSNSPRSKIPYGAHPRIGEANIYFSLHPVHRDLLGRIANKIEYASQTTSDEDIVAYDLLAIDVDPVRRSNISSTDKEKAEALKVAADITEWLLENNVKPIPADSGNGAHLLIPTIPYAGSEISRAAEDAKEFLHILAEKFNTDKAKVDTTVFNPARIFRLYGSQTKKGSDMPKVRPHRWASIDLSDIPDDVDLF